MIVAGLGVVWGSAVVFMALDGRRRAVGWAAVAALAIASVLLAILLGQVVVDGTRDTVAGGWPQGLGIRLRADALGVVFALVSTLVLLSALAYEVASGACSRTLPSIVLFMATGLIGIFLTADVFNFYVFFELAMIAAYVLTAHGGGSRQIGAAFIFAVVNLLGSFLFLIGIGALYHVTGTLDMDGVSQRLLEVDTTSTLIIGVTLFVAFGVKLGLFPFHFWLPAVYAGARPAVAAMLSGALANIGAYGLLRFGGDMLDAEVRVASTALIILGTASILYGSLQALSRRTATEVLAYSSIGQAGYVIVAIAVGGSVGFAAAILYAIVNSLNKTLLFLAVGVRGALVGTAFVIGALSVAGVPPTAGFWGKVALFQTGIGVDGTAGAVALVALIFLGGALSFVYMFQIYQADFWRSPDEGPASSAVMRGAAVAVAVVIVVLGIWPEPLLAISEEAAGVLRGAR
jgi:multicomponent Na+:H+ antiporter subunit D